MKEVGSYFDDFVISFIEKLVLLDNGGCVVIIFFVFKGENNYRVK